MAGKNLVAIVALLAGATIAVAQERTKDPFEVHRLARAGGRYSMLLRQFRAERPGAPEREEAGRKPALARFGNEHDLPAGYWVWQRPFWFVFRDGPDTVPVRRKWGTEAACGPPDVLKPGDDIKAWATLGENDKGEWLLLEWAEPVQVTAIEIHENFNPGAVRSVVLLLPDGRELEVWNEPKPRATGKPSRKLQVDVPLGFVVQRVRLAFACDTVKGWNEIDAVGLKDPRGKLHWAAKADASSTYATKVTQPAEVILIDPPVEWPNPQPLPNPKPKPAAATAENATAAQKALAKAKKIAVLEAKIAAAEAELARLRAELERARGGK
ncbi:MAG: hypothetical protein NXI31_26875 [bacterium]|nr:hypothetical protein [bacterium]